MNLRDPNERTALAGEYVLGTFDDAERRGFEHQLENDATLRAEVSRWHDRVLSLSTRLAPVPPAPGLWQELESEILSARAARQKADERGWFWRSVELWQMLTALAVTLVLVFGALLLMHWSAQRESRLVALLQDGSGVPSFVLEARPRTGVRLRPLSITYGMAEQRLSGGAFQFWTRMPGASDPVVLGVLDSDESTEIPASRLPGLVEGQEFGITLTRPSASPEDVPPLSSVMYTGKVVALPQ